MERRPSLYRLTAAVVIAYVAYAVINHYVADPGAEAFRSHKAGLEHELKLRIWLPVLYAHIGFACFAMLSGLLNLSARAHAGRRRLHRANGYAYVVSVLAVVLTSGYLAPYATGGRAASMGFNLLNIWWLAVTATALLHVFRKRFARHRRWMIRSYAYCFTNLAIHLLTFAFDRLLGLDYAVSYTSALYGSVALLAAIPEVMFRLGCGKAAAEF